MPTGGVTGLVLPARIASTPVPETIEVGSVPEPLPALPTVTSTSEPPYSPFSSSEARPLLPLYASIAVTPGVPPSGTVTTARLVGVAMSVLAGSIRSGVLEFETSSAFGAAT